MTTTKANQLGGFCAGTRFDDLPPVLVARTTQHILDTLGAALAGSAERIMMYRV